MPISFTVATEDTNVDALLETLKHGGVRLFHTRCSIEYEVLGAGGGA